MQSVGSVRGLLAVFFDTLGHDAALEAIVGSLQTRGPLEELRPRRLVLIALEDGHRPRHHARRIVLKIDLEVVSEVPVGQEVVQDLVVAQGLRSLLVQISEGDLRIATRQEEERYQKERGSELHDGISYPIPRVAVMMVTSIEVPGNGMGSLNVQV